MSDTDRPRVLVAGTRTFSDRALLFNTMDRLTRRLVKPIILTGGGWYWLKIDGKPAKVGADVFAEEWACQRYHTFMRFSPDFDSHKSPECFLIRDREMVEELSKHRLRFAAVFWDGKSRGTKFTMDLCRKAGVKIEVIKVKCPPIPATRTKRS